MNTLLLEVAKIRQSYSKKTVVNNLSFGLNKGVIGCLLGPSGCGKTTVLRCIAGFEPVSEGEVLLNGVRVSSSGFSLRPEQRHIGMVFQDYALFPHLFVAENIAFGVPHKDIDFDRVKDAAKNAKVYDEINALVDGFSTITGENGIGLSGGQRQRIGIARALYKKSAVIILDEATNALDDNTEREVMEIIHNMSNKITILIIAHRLTTLKKCDVIYELKNGVIVKSGTYSEIVN
jgi:ABC-type multidrug transport system fused ATPase/permease subunit